MFIEITYVLQLFLFTSAHEETVSNCLAKARTCIRTYIRMRVCTNTQVVGSTTGAVVCTLHHEILNPNAGCRMYVCTYIYPSLKTFPNVELTYMRNMQKKLY